MTVSTMTADLAAMIATPIFGATEQRGINSTGDAINGGVTFDGVSFDSLWDDVISGFDEWNTLRNRLSDLLAFRTVLPGEPVPQGVSSPSFEPLTEYGVPNSANVPATALVLGYDIRDYGIRCDFTWRSLRKLTAKQIEATINGIFHSDNRLVTGSILKRLLNPVSNRNVEGFECRGLYNGDEMIPPAYLGNEFDAGTTHYWKSGAVVVDSGDIEDAVRTIKAKGYGVDPSSRLLILAHPSESEAIQTFRAGEESRSGGPIARHSFIPARNQPAYLQPDNIIGEPVEGELWGVQILGSYGPTSLVESAFIPQGYVIVVATSGPNSEMNCIGVREHPIDSYRGLIAQPGNTPFPLIGSEYIRIMGTGVRQRGAAVAIQIGTGAANSYAAPTIAL